MTTVNIYLNFDGDCEEAFLFYKSVFGGEFPYMGRFEEMPANPGFEIPESDKKRIMHVSLPISEKTVLMGSDVMSGDQTFRKGNNFSIFIDLKSKEEADRLFAALSAGGKVTMPMSDTFWRAYHGMLTDRFGINWMINVSLQ